MTKLLFPALGPPLVFGAAAPSKRVAGGRIAVSGRGSGMMRVFITVASLPAAALACWVTPMDAAVEFGRQLRNGSQGS